MPAAVAPGAAVEVRVGADTVMLGTVDEVSISVDKNSHRLSLSGRDGAAVLVDCSAPVFVRRMATLPEIIKAVVTPLGIKRIRIDAAATRTREKINIEPGATAWDVLAQSAEANGLWPWFAPDGTLVVGGPDYATPPVATLVMRRSGAGNNVLGLDLSVTMAGRYSELTVLGQTHGTETETGKHALHATAYDASVPGKRPKIIIDNESDNTAIAKDRARKLLADSRMNAMSLSARVAGHRIVAPGEPGDGKVWTPGQRVRVVSDPHGLNGIYFVMARNFSSGRSGGAVTSLTLKEDGVWVLDAHPHKNKHRRGKNAIMQDAPA
jgi:prophage tail gpP-like protein